MGEPLRDLEARLERLVPRGLSEAGRARLDQQIDQLAEAVAQAPVRKGWGMRGLGAAAAVAAVGAFILLNEGREAAPVAGGQDRPGAEAGGAGAEGAEDESSYETVDFARTVGDGEDGGILLDRFDEPMRAWNYPVREMELLLDKETGLQVRIVQERREQIRVAVTSF